MPSGASTARLTLPTVGIAITVLSFGVSDNRALPGPVSFSPAGLLAESRLACGTSSVRHSHPDATICCRSGAEVVAPSHPVSVRCNGYFCLRTLSLQFLMLSLRFLSALD